MLMTMFEIDISAEQPGAHVRPAERCYQMTTRASGGRYMGSSGVMPNAS